MIVRKLRERKNWSQEQLATLSGLNVRTIQRIESGNKASLESLKSLASVLEVDISTLTEAVIVIDKESESWKSQPNWIKISLLGVAKRRPLLQVEFICLAGGFITWLVNPNIFATPAFFLLAYVLSKLIAHADRRRIW